MSDNGTDERKRAQTRIPSAEEVAHELRVHVSSIYRAVESGHLSDVRLSEHGAVRIPRSALTATKDESSR